MSALTIIIITIAIAFIIGGIYSIKKSAIKFNLSAKQLAQIKKRNETLDKEEHEYKDQ